MKKGFLLKSTPEEKPKTKPLVIGKVKKKGSAVEVIEQGEEKKQLHVELSLLDLHTFNRVCYS